ncbi:MAG: hypothetical protein Q9208_003664 [Pyrenodesmia sp. 3 TL-2023]
MDFRLISNEEDFSDNEALSKPNIEVSSRLGTKLLTSTILDSPPSCLEFVPSDPDYFIVGTYVLEAGDPNSSCSMLLQTISFSSAVLDLQFDPYISNRFAVATSTGAIKFLSFDRKRHELVTEENSCLVAPSPDVLVLSLKWSQQHKHPSLLAYSLSNGDAAILDTKDYRVRYSFPKAHSLEVWSTAWSLVTSLPAFYTGGDDSILCYHNLDQASEQPDEFPSPRSAKKSVLDRRNHFAGVTAILPLWVDDEENEFVLTGSYDDFVRVLQIKRGRAPKYVDLMAELNLGGGVWQLKRLNCKPPTTEPDEVTFWIIASCMHAGCRLLKIAKKADEADKDSAWTIEIVGRFEKHESMNYASDTQPSPNLQTCTEATFVSTSFYDKKLCIWKLEDAPT